MNAGQGQHRLLCIVCPEGCELDIQEKDGELVFTSRACRRGREYARQELTDPRRVLTSTVRLRSGEIARVPVKTAAPIPKASLEPAMRSIAEIEVEAPVRAGQVLCPDVAGTGIALVACRSVPAALAARASGAGIPGRKTL